MLAGKATAQKSVSFPTEDGRVIYADVYGAGARGIVLAHGVVLIRRAGRAKLKSLRQQSFEC